MWFQSFLHSSLFFRHCCLNAQKVGTRYGLTHGGQDHGHPSPQEGSIIVTSSRSRTIQHFHALRRLTRMQKIGRHACTRMFLLRDEFPRILWLPLTIIIIIIIIIYIAGQQPFYYVRACAWSPILH
jgi:hypothetical protein